MLITTRQERTLLASNFGECFPDYHWRTVCRFICDVPNNGLVRYYSTCNVDRLVVTDQSALRDI